MVSMFKQREVYDDEQLLMVGAVGWSKENNDPEKRYNQVGWEGYI